MTPEQQRAILDVLEGTEDMTIATVRPDGYPQATTVSFVSDGLAIYFGTGDHSQKANNIGRNNRVSLSVNLPHRSWDDIRGVSMGATAQRVTDPHAVERVAQLMLKKFPQVAQYASSYSMAGVAFYRVQPKVVSILDYRKAFGHTDLVFV